MPIKLTNHAQKRRQQRNINIDLICALGKLIDQEGGEAIFFMDNKNINPEIKKLRKRMKKIQDGCEEGDILLIKKEIKNLEKHRGQYIALTSCGAIKTCSYSTSRHQKHLLRERKGYRGRKGKKRHRTREMYRD